MTNNMARVIPKVDMEDLEMEIEMGIEIGEVDGLGETPRAYRFGDTDMSVPAAPTPRETSVAEEKIEISPVNVQDVSQFASTGVDSDTNFAVKIVSGIDGNEKDVEELVEIKPRPRAKHNGSHKSHAHKSGIAGRIPEVERYDPNLTSNQLRVEGGQLRDRNGNGNDGNRGRGVLLPSAFKPKKNYNYVYTCTGPEDDNDNMSEPSDVLSDEQCLALSGVQVSEGKLRRRYGNFGHVIECYAYDAAEALVALTRLLKREFGGTIISCGTTELRLKIPIPIDGTPRQIVVGAAGQWNGGCTLAFRKSLIDLSKMEPYMFMQWVGQVRSRMCEIEEEQQQQDGS